MKVFFLNPPHELPIMRRYMCSYYSPEYMLPPYDLLSLATYVRERNQADVEVLDAIVEKLALEDVINRIDAFSPDIIVVLMGIKVFGDDLACVTHLKEHFSEIPLAVFGYYPTGFPEDLLKRTAVDFVLRREPEMPLSQYLEARQEGASVESIPGLAGHKSDGSLFNNQEQRIQDINSLPFPDPLLVNIHHYEEAFLGGPCAAILSIRGCPFSCNYCTTTYGRSVSFKSPESVFAEMRYLKGKDIKIIRFLDDIFTYDKSRVISICKLLIDNNLGIPWTCLSRIDTIDAEMLAWMYKAGCKRIMIGIESYSPNVLNKLNKGISPEIINPQLKLIQDSGIETLAFFMVGAPFETEDDFKMTVRGALASPLDFITVNTLEPFATTPYFEQMADDIDFNLFPFRCTYKNLDVYRTANERRRRLYRHFYLRPKVLFSHLLTFIKNPRRSIRLLGTFLFPQKPKFPIIPVSK